MASRIIDMPVRSAAPVGPARFLAIGAAAAFVAASAAYLGLLAGLPVWAMFMGWIVFSSRGGSARDGASNFACFAIGLVIGVEAMAAVAALTPAAGSAALPLVVLVVTTIVGSLRGVPALNNLLAYFLGLTTVFAAQSEPTFAANAGLGAAGALGVLAGWLASLIQKRLSAAK